MGARPLVYEINLPEAKRSRFLLYASLVRFSKINFAISWILTPTRMIKIIKMQKYIIPRIEYLCFFVSNVNLFFLKSLFLSLISSVFVKIATGI